MSKIIICRTLNGTLEEVNDVVFKNREHVVLENGKPRYTEESFCIDGGKIRINGTLDRDTFALLGRSLGVQTATSAKFEKCPKFVFVQRRKTAKMQLMNTENGDIYKK